MRFALDVVVDGGEKAADVAAPEHRLAGHVRRGEKERIPYAEQGSQFLDHGRVPAGTREHLMSMQDDIRSLARDLKLEGDKSQPLFNSLNRWAIQSSLIKKTGGPAAASQLAALRNQIEVQLRGFLGEGTAKAATKNLDKFVLK